MPPESARWLLLVHQIPPSPAYLRVKIRRRLQRIGALPIKNTVYVLPRSDSTLEDFQWVLREIRANGGEATLCEAKLVDGLSDVDVELRFQELREPDYRELASEARELARKYRRKLTAESNAALQVEVRKLEERLEAVTAIDFFGALGRETVLGVLGDLRLKLQGSGSNAAAAQQSSALEQYQGRVWVTRSGVHVDRIASAWLVSRFIDPKPSFKFVAPRGYVPEAGELRFDMFEAEFTHEGDSCTFEVLQQRLGVRAPGLQAIGEIVHDIDIKDGKFARPETAGVAAAIAGIALCSRSDEERLARGNALFDELCAYFARKRKTNGERQT